jgi:hypothetical protein
LTSVVAVKAELSCRPAESAFDSVARETPCQELTPSLRNALLPAMWRFANIRVARMSSGQHCLIRDLGLVKGGKGLRHHELVLEVSGRGLIRFVATRIRSALHHINRKPPEQLRIRDGAGLMAD